jgi:organic hydroperoxide reductase OsmC/OhrA
VGDGRLGAHSPAPVHSGNCSSLEIALKTEGHINSSDRRPDASRRFRTSVTFLAALVCEAHEKVCPYSHATRGNVDVKFDVVGA